MVYNIENTIKSRHKVNRHHDKYSSSGVYKLKYWSYEQVYIGEMDRCFRTRFEGVHKIY